MQDEFNNERYHRQVILKQFGAEGQRKLLNANVLVVGAGGLGCPVLQYLAAAGVGHIGIVDHDVVSLTNLHRQILYTENDIGFLKAERAKARLEQMNSGIRITTFPVQITTENAPELLRDFDIIIDGTDNFATRYLINDICVLLKKTLVYGAISQFEGQVAVFNHSGSELPVNYRDLFPHPPAEDEVQNCAEAGVLGVLPGLIGTMMANETIKLITGIGEPLVNQLFTCNLLTNQNYTIRLQPTALSATLIPGDIPSFRQTNYEWLCRPTAMRFEIGPERFYELLAQPGPLAIDVREPDEIPQITAFLHRRIPMGQLNDGLNNITESTILLFCQSGKRSLKAARELSEQFGADKIFYSLRGGVSSL